VTVTNKLAEGKAVLADTAQIAVPRDVAPSVTLLAGVDSRRAVRPQPLPQAGLWRRQIETVGMRPPGPRLVDPCAVAGAGRGRWRNGVGAVGTLRRRGCSRWCP
jgi:hypothetical protein